MPKKKDTPNFDQLRPKQKRFVMEALQPGNTLAKAVVAAGYKDNPHAVAAQSMDLMNNPKVQRAISEIVMDMYPNAGEECIDLLRRFIHDDSLSPRERMDAMKMLASFLGWQAPSKHQTVKAIVNMSKYQLPGSGK